MSHRVAPPALRPVLLLVTSLTKRHQVRSVERYVRIVDVFSRQRYPMMHMNSRFDQSFAHADLTQSTMLLQNSLTTLSPGMCGIKTINNIIVMHPWTLLAIVGVRPAAGEESHRLSPEL